MDNSSLCLYRTQISKHSNTTISTLLIGLNSVKKLLGGQHQARQHPRQNHEALGDKEAATLHGLLDQYVNQTTVYELEMVLNFQKRDRHLPLNCCAVLMAVVCGELLQYTISKRTRNHRSPHSPLADKWHGFRKHFRKTQILIIFHDLTGMWDQSKQPDPVVLSSSKALTAW